MASYSQSVNSFRGLEKKASEEDMTSAHSIWSLPPAGTSQPPCRWAEERMQCKCYVSQPERKKSPQIILQIPFPAVTTTVTTVTAHSSSGATGWGSLSKTMKETAKQQWEKREEKQGKGDHVLTEIKETTGALSLI